MFSVLRLSLTFAILCSSAITAQTAPSPAHSGHLTVWISSSRNVSWNTMFGELRRDFPDLDVDWKLQSPDAFVSAIDAAQVSGTLPDVVFIDNARQADPLWQWVLISAMAGRSRFAESGWWFLVKDSRNAAQARAFLLWLEEPSIRQPYSPRTELLTAEQKASISRTAIQIMQARLQSSAPPSKLLDPALASFNWSSMRTRYAEFSNLPQSSPTILEIGGNERLAFVSVATPVDAGKIFGIVHSFLLFRKDDDAWKLIFLDDSDSIDGVARLFDRFDSLNLANIPAPPPTAVTLRAPADEESLTRFPKPWLVFSTTGTSPGLIGIESQFADQHGQNWSPTRLDWVQRTGDTTIRTLAPFGVGFQPHRWRVWTIDQAGSITLSEWRTINFTN